MNKTELVKCIAEKVEISQAKAAQAVSVALESVLEALAKGDKVTLIGFGTFSTAKRAARMGVNPRDGKPLNIPARTAVKFTAGKELKDAVQS